MDVIVKLLHRSDGLNKSENANFYLEVDENIKIHYRDLQIELSRKEFEVIARAFSAQSAELMKIMKTVNYQDRPSPDAARENVKIWTDSQLEPESACTPRQISLEECNDGFHLHYRNLRLILDRNNIYALKKALKTTDVDVPYASTFEDFQDLLKTNGIKYSLSEINGPRLRGNHARRIIVDESEAAKVRRIMTGIGMEGKLTDNSQVYSKDTFSVELMLSEDELIPSTGQPAI